jgi:hypothetical protein
MSAAGVEVTTIAPMGAVTTPGADTSHMAMGGDARVLDHSWPS